MLTQFIRQPEVAQALKALRPKLPRTIKQALRVAPCPGNPQRVGTAFHYLLLSELARRAPHAKVSRLPADNAYITHQIVRRGTADAATQRKTDRMREVGEQSRKGINTYINSREGITPDQQAEAAGHAIRLAALDVMKRVGKEDPALDEIDPAEVQNLIEMLAIVPFPDLLHDTVLHLYPRFGKSSQLVGGADADVITGDRLVDIKVFHRGEMQATDLDQLLGYLLLARNERLTDPSFPEIGGLGIYFARHGYLWQFDIGEHLDPVELCRVEAVFMASANYSFAARLRREEEINARIQTRRANPEAKS